MNIESQSWRVSVQRKIDYEILNSPNLFDPQNTDLLYPGWSENARRFVVVDNNVLEHYSNDIHNYFDYHGINAKIVGFPCGEEHKTIDCFLSIVRQLDTFPIHRRDEPIIMVGGGVLTDVVGFVASSYRRSIPHIKVPTTLMGYVDAAIGIKNGINFDGHKNRLGSFEPPLRVLLDKTFLSTLSKRHILNGVSEIIKLAVIKDCSLFSLLEEHGSQSVNARFQDEAGGKILDLAITGMLEELEPNLFEDDLARRVDFGHSFGYGLEINNESHLLHGEAVLLDILISTMIAKNRGLLSGAEMDRICFLIDKLGFKLNTSLLEADILWQSLEERTYHRNGIQRVPLPKGIGECIFVNDITFEEIQSAHHTLVNKMVIEHG